MTEFDQKQERLQALLDARGLDALLLQRVSSFAWATCGAASYVNTATSDGAAALLITPSGRYLITNNIEGPRLADEEALATQGWEFQVSPWYQTNVAIAHLTRGLRLGSDAPYPGATELGTEMSRLRTNLVPEEQARFREVSRLCAGAMDTAVPAIRPGMTEYEIAAVLSAETQRRGVQPIVNLIATDERVFRFRHPLPTGKTMEHYAMLVLCGRRYGLVCSLTRLLHFGRLPGEVKRKAEAVARVDAAFIAATRPGRVLGDIFCEAQAVYAQTGFSDEWQLHHQGGPAGYEPREFVATPETTDVVTAGQVYAWNPSIAGVKSEDTLLVREDGVEIMTEIAGWPTMPVTIAGQTIQRPAILQIPHTGDEHERAQIYDRR